MLLLPPLLMACSLAGPRMVPEVPAEAARHSAALASVIVENSTLSLLTIAFRSAAPPIREVVIGTVASGRRQPLAPIPAGEPIVMVARRDDGAEIVLAPRSFEIDAEWTWEIPHDAVFRKPKAR